MDSVSAGSLRAQLIIWQRFAPKLSFVGLSNVTFSLASSCPKRNLWAWRCAGALAKETRFLGRSLALVIGTIHT